MVSDDAVYTLDRSTKGGINRWLVGLLVAATDVFTIGFACIVSVLVYREVGEMDAYGQTAAFVYALLVSLTYCWLTFQKNGYEVGQLRSLEITHVLCRWGASLAVGFTVLFLLKAGDILSRGTLLLFAALGGFLLVWQKFLVTAALRHAALSGAIRPLGVCVLSGTASPERHLAALTRDPLISVTEHVCIVPGRQEVSLHRTIELGRKSNAIDAFALSIPWSDTVSMQQCLAILRKQLLPVYLLPDNIIQHQIRDKLTILGAMPVVTLMQPPLSATDRFWKRLFDIAASAVVLVSISPLLATIAMAIKIDSPGPCIFRQRRNGFNNKVFTIYKFRTMEFKPEDDGVRQAQKNDQRVTRVGAFLRRTSLDELPQLLNVLAGDMSVVGPRPHAVAHNHVWEGVVKDYALRHHIKPGITGLAQVNGLRGEVDTPEKIQRRVSFDLEYIDRWSLLGDCRIILATAFRILREPNAY
jgi:Undecaprenyl-phosphate glucose phosphotransferase